MFITILVVALNGGDSVVTITLLVNVHKNKMCLVTISGMTASFESIILLFRLRAQTSQTLFPWLNWLKCEAHCSPASGAAVTWDKQIILKLKAA